MNFLRMLEAVKQIVLRFFVARHGHVALMLALLAVPLVLGAGLAVDFTRVYRVHSIMQGVLDSAALAAGRAAQVNPNTSVSSARQAAQMYFATLDPPEMLGRQLAFSAGANGTEFALTATSWVETPFLRSLMRVSAAPAESGAPTPCGSSKYACVKVVTTSVAVIGVGPEVEVAIMLDVTGSMAGKKLETLKAAAKDLVDTVLFSNQGRVSARIGIVPFAGAVNAGPYFHSLTGEAPSGPETCIQEREGAEETTDAPPGPNAFAVKHVLRCAPTQPIIPLTQTAADLKSGIDNLSAWGGTAGGLGTAYAWYLLSPQWAGVWGPSRGGKAYGETRKVAILMTDGAYNLKNGVPRGQTTINKFVVKLCTAMREKGIQIYTVGFDMDKEGAASKGVLLDCASSPDNYYDANDGTKLLQAFRDIALKISALRLTN